MKFSRQLIVFYGSSVRACSRISYWRSQSRVPFFPPMESVEWHSETGAIIREIRRKGESRI